MNGAKSSPWRDFTDSGDTVFETIRWRDLKCLQQVRMPLYWIVFLVGFVYYNIVCIYLHIAVTLDSALHRLPCSSDSLRDSAGHVHLTSMRPRRTLGSKSECAELKSRTAASVRTCDCDCNDLDHSRVYIYKEQNARLFTWPYTQPISLTSFIDVS